LADLGLIGRVHDRQSRNAAGANTFHQLYEKQGLRWNGGQWDAPKIDNYMKAMDAGNLRADTLASAIEINRRLTGR
jgi:threonine synthase